MTREDAGMAHEVPTIILAAEQIMSRKPKKKILMMYVQISHHTGAQLMALLVQTIELANCVMQASPVQNM